MHIYVQDIKFDLINTTQMLPSKIYSVSVFFLWSILVSVKKFVLTC